MDNYLKFKELINSSNHIVFFGGAGVSTESNIPDFRSKNGLYNTNIKDNPEYLSSHDCFINEPGKFYHFDFDKMIYDDAKPNDAKQFFTKSNV